MCKSTNVHKGSQTCKYIIFNFKQFFKEFLGIKGLKFQLYSLCLDIIFCIVLYFDINLHRRPITVRFYSFPNYFELLMFLRVNGYHNLYSFEALVNARIQTVEIENLCTEEEFKLKIFLQC